MSGYVSLMYVWCYHYSNTALTNDDDLCVPGLMLQNEWNGLFFPSQNLIIKSFYLFYFLSFLFYKPKEFFICNENNCQFQSFCIITRPNAHSSSSFVRLVYCKNIPVFNSMQVSFYFLQDIVVVPQYFVCTVKHWIFLQQ